LYHAKQRKGFVEWKDMKWKAVAIEMPAVDRDSDAEKLEVLVPLDKKMLDMMSRCGLRGYGRMLQLRG
jgi:hypothetical protein